MQLVYLQLVELLFLFEICPSLMREMATVLKVFEAF